MIQYFFLLPLQHDSYLPDKLTFDECPSEPAWQCGSEVKMAAGVPVASLTFSAFLQRLTIHLP